MASEDTSLRAIFCYGTLMSPDVTKRVLSGCRYSSFSDLVFTDGTLHGYKRHALSDEMYPAIISSEGSSVLGKLVRNITREQLQYLDQFEGSEYKREVVDVCVQGEDAPSKAYCYIWVDDIDRLLPEDWNYQSFIR
ncbi:uncharacterized protein V1510DRAFT_410408 [Dipodascopsis tothii]|uniref:uncharacterized protein n=1 Tax=Dipodascopsis tothii TaxID=44089 RepID=UPI0034CFE878